MAVKGEQREVTTSVEGSCGVVVHGFIPVVG